MDIYIYIFRNICVHEFILTLYKTHSSSLGLLEVMIFVRPTEDTVGVIGLKYSYVYVLIYLYILRYFLRYIYIYRNRYVYL